MYRPPNQNVADFIFNLNILMSKISRENKTVYIMVDFNLNLLNQQFHQFTNEFLDIMYTNLLFPLITLPTRITSYTATIIDNIFTNDLEIYSFSGLILSVISDHLPISGMSYEIFRERDEALYIEYGDKSAKNIFNFRNCLYPFQLV